MRMGLEAADRVEDEATEFLSMGVGTTKADAPHTRSAAVHATYLGAMMLLFNPPRSHGNDLRRPQLKRSTRERKVDLSRAHVKASTIVSYKGNGFKKNQAPAS